MTDDPVTLHWSYNAKNMEEKLSLAADRIEQLEKGFVDILSQQPLDLVVAMIAKACLVGAIDKNGKYCFVGDLKIVDGKPLMGKKNVD